MNVREIFDRRGAWLGVGVAVAALLAGGLYFALGDGSDGSSDGADKAVQVGLPAATNGDDSSPSGQGTGGGERRGAPAKRGSTSKEKPGEGQSHEGANPPDAEQTPPTQQSSVSEQSSVNEPNRPETDPPPVRKPNRPETDPPPVRKPNRYGGQPSAESGGQGGESPRRFHLGDHAAGR